MVQDVATKNPLPISSRHGIFAGVDLSKMRLKPELKGALLTSLGIALILVGVWVFIGFRIGIWTPVQYDRYIWLTENLPVADLLWHGKIRAGDDAEILVKDWRPHELTRFGPWIEMYWFPGGPDTNRMSFIGMFVLAKNGKLVLARSYTDDRVDNRLFFNTLTPTDEVEYRAALKAYVAQLQAEREKTGTANASQQFHTETNQIDGR